MRQRHIFPLLISAVLSTAIFALAACITESTVTTGIHCGLLTNDGRVRMHWVTETGDLDTTLSISTRGTGPTELVLGLFVDGWQWPAVWDGEQAKVCRLVLEPGANRDIQFGIRGLSAGVHALHLLTAVLPSQDRDFTESQIMNSGSLVSLHPFTVDSRSPIDAPLEPVVCSATGSPATDVQHAVGGDGILCIDPDVLGVDPSFDIRDRQVLHYMWRNDGDVPIAARLVLLVDWLERPWPEQKVAALVVRAAPDEALVTEIDLSRLPIGDASYVMVVAFIEPQRPAWKLDESGDTYYDPEGGRAWASNYVVVLGP